MPVTDTQQDQLERAAMGSSLLCLLHCLALPFLLAAAPAAVHGPIASENFHLWVLAFAVPASGVALWVGRSRHGAAWPLLLGALGLALLTTGALPLGGTAGETPVTILGSVALVAAHVGNWRMRHRHPHPAA